MDERGLKRAAEQVSDGFEAFEGGAKVARKRDERERVGVFAQADGEFEGGCGISVSNHTRDHRPPPTPAVCTACITEAWVPR